MMITLRKMIREDAKALFPLTSDEECGKFMKTGPHKSFEQTKEMVEKYLRKENLGFIVETESQEMVGYTGLSKMAKDGQYSISIMTFPKFWKGGLSTKAIQKTIEEGRKSGFVHEIIAFVVQENIGSIKIVNKCGFQQIDTIQDGPLTVNVYRIKTGNSF